MRFSVVGADRESGDDVEVFLDAASQTAAEELAIKRGIMVSAIKEMPAVKKDESVISLVDDEPASPSAPAAHAGPPHAAHAPAAHAPGKMDPSGHAAAPGKQDTNGHGAATAGAPAAPAHPHEQHGHITVSASSPSDTAHTSEGTTPMVHHEAQAMEYHILMNQALYLLETAVNKHLRDGWEPQGGLTVGVANNAMQYFQAVIRKKKV